MGLYSGGGEFSQSFAVSLGHFSETGLGLASGEACWRAGRNPDSERYEALHHLGDKNSFWLMTLNNRTTTQGLFISSPALSAKEMLDKVCRPPMGLDYKRGSDISSALNPSELPIGGQK